MRGYKFLLVVGAALLVAVVSWQLLSSSYAHDLHTICDAEKRSGITYEKEPGKLGLWMKSNVDSAEGVALVTDLVQKKKGDGAVQLTGEAKKAGITSCTLADTYTKYQVEADYKADIARMCAGMEFPNLDQQDNDGRMAKLKEWADKNGKSPKLASFVNELAQLPAEQRGKRLRDEAAANDKYMCEVAETLDKPYKPRPPGSEGPQVRVLTPQINGTLKPDVLDKAVNQALPSIKKCYTDALVGKSDLQGRLIVKMSLSEKGKPMKVGEGTGGFPDAGVVQCVGKIFEGMDFGPQTGPLTVVFLPIDFTPN